ncbi:MAG: hypothetical protein JW996_04605 [Candidatus Cloacimonetes bacterium]|nr:hypothetical protein [Candidatus Cloacimonadota bacterium]
MRFSRLGKIIFIITITLFIQLSAHDEGLKEEVYFKNTDYELRVYRIYGSHPGKTMMLIGGIQGDEPGGYLSADLYVDVSLERGNLIVVPRANLLSIIKNKRIIFKDMNRRFRVQEGDTYEDKVVTVLKQLISESDVLLNLHDGGGFYRPVYIDDKHNPMKYGQCIIADVESYYSSEKGETFELGEIADEVCRIVNQKIPQEEYHFHFNNHNTVAEDSPHKEQRNSATYYALTVQEIPAFGIETSRDLPSDDLKVYHHNLVINEMMRIFGIIPSHPKLYLEIPYVDFVLIRVNDQRHIVDDGGILEIQPDSRIEILHVDSNYDRGLITDIIGYGNNNDFGGQFLISEDTEILIKKDKYVAGTVSLRIKQTQTEQASSYYRGLAVEINGGLNLLFPGEHITIARDSEFRIISTIPNDLGAQVNFVGYPHPINNFEDDTGILINTGTDLLEKFSLDRGRTYEIYVKYKGDKIAYHNIILEDPILKKMTLLLNDQEMVKNAEETLLVKRGDVLKIIGAETTVRNDAAIKINFRGYVTDPAQPGEDRHNEIIIGDNLIPSFSLDGQGQTYEILTHFKGDNFGRILVKITE